MSKVKKKTKKKTSKKPSVRIKVKVKAAKKETVEGAVSLFDLMSTADETVIEEGGSKGLVVKTKHVGRALLDLEKQPDYTKGTSKIPWDDLVEMVIQMQACYYPEWKIRKEVTRVMGKQTTKSFLIKCISGARARMKAREFEAGKNGKMDAIEFYQMVIGSKDAKFRDRIKAQERLDSLLGHDAKFGDQGEHVEDKAAKIRETLKQMRSTVPTKPAKPPIRISKKKIKRKRK